MYPRSRPTRKNAASPRRPAGRAVASRRVVMAGKGARVARSTLRGPFLPPENWYEPGQRGSGDYKVIVAPAGSGYRHVLTEDEVRQRLNQLPESLLAPLEVVQMSQMTRKRRIAPCYGMQWGSAVYLYPIEENLVEKFTSPPKPSQQIEARMFGAQWQQTGAREWSLFWTEEAIKDFYLNNVLIHELGHVLDSRNSRSIDRERYAEWFAVEHGYKASRRADLAERAASKYVVRRHHRKG
ncbi:MAG TPA: hypothetical protein VMP01_28830 [Pirellulaceae bacterium]|nr:hypothetical protein [Pirellulaceae bacterium]